MIQTMFRCARSLLNFAEKQNDYAAMKRWSWEILTHDPMDVAAHRILSDRTGAAFEVTAESGGRSVELVLSLI